MRLCELQDWPVVGRIARHRDFGRGALLGLRRVGGHPERNHAGPDLQLDVGVEVLWRTRARLRRRLVDGQRQHRRRGEFLVLRAPCLVGAAGAHVLDDRLQRVQLLGAILDHSSATEDDCRAVVERMVVDRAGEDDAVDERHGHADVDTAAELTKHAAGRRAVQVQQIPDSYVDGRDDERLRVDNESDMAMERLVEDGIDRLALVEAPLGMAADAAALGQLSHRAPPS